MQNTERLKTDKPIYECSDCGHLVYRYGKTNGVGKVENVLFEANGQPIWFLKRNDDDLLVCPKCESTEVYLYED